MLKNKYLFVLSFVCLLLCVGGASAEWDNQDTPAGLVFRALDNTEFTTASGACEYTASNLNANPPPRYPTYENSRAGYDGTQPACFYTLVYPSPSNEEYEFVGTNWYSILKQCSGSAGFGGSGCGGPRPPKTKGCPVGNPVMPDRGTKKQESIDIELNASLNFTRIYSSWHPRPFASPIGEGWFIKTFGRRLEFEEVNGVASVFALRSLGDIELFTLSGTDYIAEDYNADTLTFDQTENLWLYKDYDNISTERYLSDGTLYSISYRTGRIITLTYSDASTPVNIAPTAGLLIAINDNLNNSILIEYDSEALVSKTTLGAEIQVTYSYLLGLLDSVTKEDGSILTYHYEADTNGPKWVNAFSDGLAVRGGVSAAEVMQYAPELIQGVEVYDPGSEPPEYTKGIAGEFQFRPLTGVTDETGQRLATYEYNSIGKVVQSSSTSQYSFVYNADGSTTVTNALGKETTYFYQVINGRQVVEHVEGHPSTNCEGANKFNSYSPEGFIISKTDWNGVVTTYTRDLHGNELIRTDAAGTPSERVTTTEWHVDFRLPTKITELGRVIDMVYDGSGKLLSRTIGSLP